MCCIASKWIIGVVLLSTSAVGNGSCPDASDLQYQYQQLSLQMSQIGFQISQLGLPLTDPRVVQLELKYAAAKKQRDAVQARLSACESP